MEPRGLTDTFRWRDEPRYTVDVFGDVAILSLYEELDPRPIVEELTAEVKLRAVYLKRRPKKAHGAMTELVAPVEPCWGEKVDTLVAHENGMRFEIRPANGLSVGLYLDARDARAWVVANAMGKTVLNLFAYTCGFGVAAMTGGASRTLNIDRSRKVLDWGEHNYALNGYSPSRRDFLAADVFDQLARMKRRGEHFELAVLDPPSFATSGRSRFSAAKDYPRLVSEVAPLCQTLLACCNLEAVDTQTVERWVAQSMRVVDRFGAPEDFRRPSALKVVVASRR